MTLDEAIKHAEEVAEKKEKDALMFKNNPILGKVLKDYEVCLGCAAEHRQLAEWLKDYKRLLEQEPCDDCISRQAVLNMIENAQIITDGEFCGYCTEDIDINILPPVTPQPKTGHWIEDEYEMEVRCSACGEENDKYSKYCPDCGCRMVEPQESEG